MREILFSVLLLFSFSLSVQAITVTSSPHNDVLQVEVSYDSDATTAQAILPERLFNVTGESTEAIYNDCLTLGAVVTSHVTESTLPFEIGWRKLTQL